MLTKHYLPDVALARVRGQLSLTNSPFTRSLAQLPIEEGDVYIYVSPSRSQEGMLEFRNDMPYSWEEAVEECRMLVKAVIEHVGAASDALAVLTTLGHGWPDLLWNGVCNGADDRDTAYYFIDKDRSQPEYVSEVVEDIRAFPFVSLTTMPPGWQMPPPHTPIPREVLDEAAARTRMLVVGAYEDGGFLYWHRKGDLL